MNILHTSDWHIGRQLHNKKRYDEFAAYFEWLLQTIDQYKIDALLVAGDIFDTTTPSHRAQTIYYQFLSRLEKTCCRQVIIIAGNHDSPSLLAAPKELLSCHDIQVVANISAQPEDEICLLKDLQGVPQVIVCAVPFLRDTDVRQAATGESLSDRERSLRQGIEQHYRHIFDLASTTLQHYGRNLPIIAMGHLFTLGGITRQNDGVRDLYVGSLGHISSAIFPNEICYVALGHLHIAQSIPGSAVRYSGSPLAMDFSEARYQKSVTLITIPEPDSTTNSAINTAIISGTTTNSTITNSATTNSAVITTQSATNSATNPAVQPASNSETPESASAAENAQLAWLGPEQITLIPVPVFQPMRTIQGDWSSIQTAVAAMLDEPLASPNSIPSPTPIWLEIILDGDEHWPQDVRQHLEQQIGDRPLEVLSIKTTKKTPIYHHDAKQTLNELTENEVFSLCLDTHNIAESERPALQHAYQEILTSLTTADSHAE